MESRGLVEKKHLFCAIKSCKVPFGTALLTLLWLAELGFETLWSGAVAGDNYSSAQTWWLADFPALRVHLQSIYDSNKCFFWFRPVETSWSLFITQS